MSDLIKTRVDTTARLTSNAHQKITARIIIELADDDPEIRNAFLSHFWAETQTFSESMAKAYVSWQDLDKNTALDENRAYVAGLTSLAMTLHIHSMKLFLSGHLIAAGNASRQVVEAISLALLCSGKDLTVLSRFIRNEYSSNTAPRDILRHAKKLGLLEPAVKILVESRDFYHKYSHPTKMSLGAQISFEGKGAYVGANFDTGKLHIYRQEIEGRVSLARIFPGIIQAVKMNVKKWPASPSRPLV